MLCSQTFTTVYFVYLLYYNFNQLITTDIIHTVGPIGENKEKLLSCYQSSLNLMLEHHRKSIVSGKIVQYQQLLIHLTLH